LEVVDRRFLQFKSELPQLPKNKIFSPILFSFRQITLLRRNTKCSRVLERKSMSTERMNQENEIVLEVEELEAKIAPASSAGFLD